MPKRSSKSDDPILSAKKVLDEIITKHDPSSEEVLNQLAINLFRKFARFEYALKAAGFHKGEGDAEPDWLRFALSIDQELTSPQSDEVRTAIDFLVNQPPKKQVIKNGLLDWKESKPSTISKADLVLIYLRRVRNNLFHGGKFNGRWFAPERSEALLRHSLVILSACLQASPDLSEAYRSNEPDAPFDEA